MMIDLQITDDDNLPFCEICIERKQHRQSFSKESSKRVTELLEVIHSDICNPMSQNSFSGGRYFVSFIDDKNR